MFNKKSNNKEYIDKVKLLASKILWSRSNNNSSAILICSAESQSSFALLEDIYQYLINSCDLKICLNHLAAISPQQASIDWDHDLNIIYLDDVCNNNHLLKITSYIDDCLMLIKAGNSSRNETLKAISLLKNYQIEVSGAILHNFREKVPGIIKRIFF